MNRSLAWIVFTCLVGGCANESDPVPNTVPGEASTPRSIENDARVTGLLFECSQEAYFGGDTSNLIPILVTKLVRGQRDPLRGAKRDLAAYGAIAEGEISALVDAQLARGANSDVLLNALGTIALMEPPTGRDIALRLLESPQEVLRIAALRALAGRFQPEDFDRVIPIVPGASRNLKSACVAPLFEASPERLLMQMELWVAASSEPDLWPIATRLLVTAPELAPQAERLRLLLEASDAAMASEALARLQALFARNHDSAALTELLRLRDSEVSSFQYLALEGLVAAGFSEELKPVLRSSPDPQLRVLAAEAIGKLSPEKTWTDALTLGLSDEDERVRKVSLTHLLARGDEAALDFAFSLLESSSSDRQVALDALAAPMKENAELTAEILELFKGLLEASPTVPARAPFYQSIGQLPSAQAAEYLLARTAIELEPIDGLDSHRWIALQAGNTGDSGRAALAEAWRLESDPVRRVDLLAGMFAGSGDAVLAIMSEAATRSDVTPFEVLVAADYLTRIGPAHACAPLLKRVALRCEESRVRRALQCLLWRFYGV